MSERKPKTHELKTLSGYFQHTWDGTKPFEVRQDDRGFRVGDKLRLREWVEGEDRYTGREVSARVTHVFDLEELCDVQRFSIGDVEWVVLGLDMGTAKVKVDNVWDFTKEGPNVPRDC